MTTLPTSHTIHSLTAELPTHSNSLTPEQLTKNMGGTTIFMKWYAVGFFRNQEDTEIFRKWLETREYELISFRGQWSVAYRARVVR
jgi:hypothetical protein